MYVVVAGGGKVGFYLAKALINEGHEVLIIERDKRKAEAIAEELGSVVLRGDAAEAAVLEEAGATRADVVVAATGDDEDNLVICQVAKRKFGTGRTIARINNPKNEHIFRLLGIDATVSSTNLILAQIEAELPKQALIHVLSLRRLNLELVEAVISPDAPVVGVPIRDVAFPPETKLLVVIRGDQTIIPTGNDTLLPGDDVLAFTRTQYEEQLRSLLMG